MSAERHNMPDLGPYAERWRLAAVEYENARADVARQENHLDVTLAVILDADEGAKTTAKERAKRHPHYQAEIIKLTEARLEMRLKQVNLKAAEMAFEEWRTQSSNRRSEMNIR